MKTGITWGERLGRPECPYMRRWVLNLHFMSFRIHHWYGSDDHRAFHDHSWGFFVFVMSGTYTDVSPLGRENMFSGTWAIRSALHKHTVEVWPGGCWTFVVTGAVIRRWGFWPNGKFRKANKYFLENGHHPCK